MAKRRRKGRGSSKGSAYERQLCKKLSLWWTHGKRDDVFWRTAGSGARATVRGKRGGRTYGSHGDIAAVDPIGEPLLDVAIISLKNGYHKCHASGLLDKPNAKVSYELEKWLKEVKYVWKLSGAFSWLIVHQRTSRAAVVYMPYQLFAVLNVEHRDVQLRPRIMFVWLGGSFVVMSLDVFLKVVTPEVIKAIQTRI